MHRYRKGQTWRPPTAGESAAHADAAEAHRRASEGPQDYHPPGQIIVVKTPAEGIPARDGDTIFWDWCERCIQVDDTVSNPAQGKTKLRVDTEERLIVHNLLHQAIPGNWHVQTALTDCGTRYVLLVDRLAWATVDGGAVATTDAEFEVTDIIMFEGGDWAGDDPLTVKNDPDEYEIAAGATGKIIFCYDPDEEWAWHPLDFPC